MTHPAPDLRALKQAAERATPGPWHRAGKDPHRVLDEQGFIVAEGLSTPSMDGRSLQDRAADQAAFISLANPAAVLWLVERVEELEKLLGNAHVLLLQSHGYDDKDEIESSIRAALPEPEWYPKPAVQP